LRAGITWATPAGAGAKAEAAATRAAATAVFMYMITTGLENTLEL
jgi:hypothetical protein